MFTVSNIVDDINRGILAHNMVEDCFSYRIIYFVNNGDNRTKYYVDTAYNSLRETLENIIRSHLSLTSGVVIASTNVLKNGECVRLQSRAYGFSLDEYFRRINGECGNNRRGNYNRYAMSSG